MIRTSRLLLLSAFLIFALNNADAQNATIKTNNGISLGFGVGASYQQSDIANSMGAGFDLSLGSNIYQKEGAFFALDWKFRFLAGENSAYDHQINGDNKYNNINYKSFNYDLELGLSLNRLRERTGIIISGFLGAGVSHGISSTDLLDANGIEYDYTVINSADERRKIVDDLKMLSDGSFEEDLVNKASILPTAGIYLGYQFSPGFAIGLIHKVNFSLNENNSFSGIDMDNIVLDGSPLDMNHYTSIGFRWYFRGKSNGSRPANLPPSIVSTPTLPQRVEPAPIISSVLPEIDITIPYRDPFVTNKRNVDVTARLMRISGKEDLSVKLDGKETDFEFFPTASKIEVSVDLVRDTIMLEISGRNKDGEANDAIVLIYKEKTNINLAIANTVPAAVTVPVQLNQVSRTGGSNRVNQTTVQNQNVIISDPVRRTNPPVVNVQAEPELPKVSFINPPSPATVDKNIFSIRAKTVNVKSWDDVSVRINGSENSFFNFSGDGSISLNIGLKEGLNEIIISGRNSAGSAREKTSITYKKPLIVEEIDPIVEEPCLDPVLARVSPLSNFSDTEEQSLTYIFNTQYIESKSQLKLSLNGKEISNFGFSANKVTVALSLKEGSNSILLSALNKCGSANLSSTIVYTKPVIEVPCLSPVVSIKIIKLNGSANSHQLRATIKNVDSKNNISLTVNGRAVNEFSFQPNTAELLADFNFEPGSYNIVLGAQNSCGSDSKSASVIVENPCISPTLTFSLTKIADANAVYNLVGSIKNVTNKNNIAMSINGKSTSAFQFNQSTGTINARITLPDGANKIEIRVSNECGTDTESRTANVSEEKPCGVRINPGNSDWQFCLVTPGGKYNRANLKNTSFSYSGSASSLYFKPIGGGGDAIVNGKAYKLSPGKDYLFTGRLTVKVSNKNPGSMGHWSICIESDSAPVSGNGNNRPVSPCEETNNIKKR